MKTRITNAPKKIYLNLGDVFDKEVDFSAFSEVTWCQDKISPNDIEYRLFESSEKEELRKELINFKNWYDKLSPASKCTVAGSGGSIGLYNLSDEDLIHKYLSQK